MFEILSTCKGGGYMYCRTNPPHPKRNSKGLYPLHRVLAENKLGRLLLPGEDVHHKDEDKSNNDPENLGVMMKSDHTKIHNPGIDPLHLVCPKCKKSFEVKPNFYRARLQRNKSGQIFCSRSCGASV